MTTPSIQYKKRTRQNYSVPSRVFFFLCKISRPSRENSDVVVFSFYFHSEKEAVLTSTRSSALQEGRWHLVEEESLRRDACDSLLRQPSTPFSYQAVQIVIFFSPRMRPEDIPLWFFQRALLQSPCKFGIEPPCSICCGVILQETLASLFIAIPL